MSADIHLTSAVRTVRGIGPAAEQGLLAAGLRTVSDLLDFLPRSYIDYTAPAALSDAVPGAASVFSVTVSSVPERHTGRTGVPVVSFAVEDANGDKALVTVFNQPYLSARLRVGTPLYLYGAVDQAGGLSRFKAPRIYTKQPDTPLVPTYAAIDGLAPSRHRQAIKDILGRVHMPEPHSEAFLRRYDLPDLLEAYRAVHLPQSIDDPSRGLRRFHVDRCFTLARVLDGIAAHRDVVNESPIRAEEMVESYCRRLPFQPTQAQVRVMREIAADLRSPRCMNRLLQGDVGSGKTAVALFAAFAVIQAGHQAIFLAPTEVLARQQFMTSQRILQDAPVFLLTGKTSQREWNDMRNVLHRQTGSLLVGTHALLYRELSLPAPALLITDEQHRFGVRQRSRLLEENSGMHSLTISATPIPRSLALAIHGQTNVSVLDESPPGRQKTKTSYVPPYKVDDMFSFIAQRAQHGQQAFIVCAAIEPSDDIGLRSAVAVYEMLQERYPDVAFGLLHGRRSSEEKEQIMREFEEGRTDVLVATTVVEVGVDVPNASVMAILDADRFGLAQLHQLRGRVGRGTGESYCFLAPASRDSLDRIRVLCTTDNGFRIAEEDLKARGAGDYLGERQHGRYSALDMLTEGNEKKLASVRAALQSMSSDPLYRTDFDWYTLQAEKQMESEHTSLILN